MNLQLTGERVLVSTRRAYRALAKAFADETRRNVTVKRDELQKVDDWLTALLANLEPAARNRMMRQLAQQLPDAAAEHQAARNPDAAAGEPRRVTACSKKGLPKMLAVCKTSQSTKWPAKQQPVRLSALRSLTARCSVLPSVHFITACANRASQPCSVSLRSVTQSAACWRETMRGDQPASFCLTVIVDNEMMPVITKVPID